LYAWGNNDSGQLGDGSYTSTNVKINPQLDLYVGSLLTGSGNLDADAYGSIAPRWDGVLIGAGSYGPNGPNWGVVENGSVKYFLGKTATLSFDGGTLFAFDPQYNLWDVYNENIVFPNTSYLDSDGNQQGNKVNQIAAAGGDSFIVTDVYKQMWLINGSGSYSSGKINTKTLVPNFSSNHVFGGYSSNTNKDPFYGFRSIDNNLYMLEEGMGFEKSKCNFFLEKSL
jgi:hypothetical protein